MNTFLKKPEKGNYIALFFVLAYISLSLFYLFTSIETWDDDCVTRYYNTLNAFNEPRHFVSIWNRPLFVVLFAIPAQFGSNFVAVCIILISSSASYYLYRGLKKQGVARPYMIIPLLLFQVYFFSVSRNMESEMLAVALFCFGYYFMVNKRWVLFALMGGMLPLARLELILLLPIWCGILLKEKQMKTILYMAIPFGLWSIGGLIVHGDLFYVLSSTFGKDNSSNRYGHTTFLHYFRRYIYVIGPISFFFLVLGYIRGFFEKSRYIWFVLLQFSAGFFVYVLFSWKLNMGNSAGFMRHLTPISALGAILMLTGLNFWIDTIVSKRRRKEEAVEENTGFKVLDEEEVSSLTRKQQKYYRKELKQFESKQQTFVEEEKKEKRRWFRKWGLILVVATVLLLIGWKYWRLEMALHHMLKLGTEYNWNIHILLAILAASLLLPWVLRWTVKREVIFAVLVGCGSLAFTGYIEAPYSSKIPERKMVETIASDFEKFDSGKGKLYINHAWFFWASGVNKYDDRYADVTMENLNNAKNGEVCIWESHYSHRLAGDVLPKFFTEHKEWVAIASYRSSETSFYSVIYQKVDSTAIASEGMKAIKGFRKIHPESLASMMASVNFYTVQSPNKDSVLHYFNRAANRHPNNLMLRFNRGATLLRQNNAEEARKDFKFLVKKKSDWDAAWVNLGIANLQLKKPQEAIKALNKALNGENKKKIKHAYYNRGNARMLLKDTTQAYADYSQEISAFPKEPHAYLQRAQINFRKANWKTSVNDFNSYLSIKKTASGNVFMMVGICHLNLKDKVSAKKYFEAALKMKHPRAAEFIAVYCR